MNEITVVVVDDHPLFRQGVVKTFLLESGIKVIGQAANGAEALELVRELRPDIAIIDINLPQLNGQQVTSRIIQEKLPTRVILLTAYDDNEQVIHAARVGAAAYCSKEVEPERLVKVVREVARGNYVIEDRVFTRSEFTHWVEEQAGQKSAAYIYSEPGSHLHPLSRREMEVLSCIVKGMSNKEIAVSLQISQQTVKNHITSILRKFGVEDRTQAVVYALKHGWVKLYKRDQSSRE